MEVRAQLTRLGADSNNIKTLLQLFEEMPTFNGNDPYTDALAWFRTRGYQLTNGAKEQLRKRVPTLLRAGGQHIIQLKELLKKMPDFRGNDVVAQIKVWFGEQGHTLDNTALNFVMNRRPEVEERDREQRRRLKDELERVEKEARRLEEEARRLQIHDDYEASRRNIDWLNATPMERLSFKDFRGLKIGRDSLSRQQISSLQGQVSQQDREAVEAAFEHPKDRAVCYRWILRGLETDRSIRKVNTDKEVAQGAIRKRTK